MDIINYIKHLSPGLPRPYSSGNNGITSLLYTNIPYDEMSSPARRCWIEERFRVYTHPLHHCSTNDSDKLEKVQLCAGLLILVFKRNSLLRNRLRN